MNSTGITCYKYVISRVRVIEKPGLTGSSLWWQGAIYDAALIIRVFLNLPFDGKDVVSAKRDHAITWLDLPVKRHRNKSNTGEQRAVQHVFAPWNQRRNHTLW